MKEPKLKNLRIDEKATVEMHLRSKKSSKVKITINIDKEIIDQLREESSNTGVPYQTLLNKILKDRFKSKDRGSIGTDERIARLEREIIKIKKKLAA